MNRLAKLSSVVLATAVAGAASAVDAASSFSLASNPNGAWSYGYATTLTGALTLDATTLNSAPIQAWQGNLAGDGNPGVYKNTSGSNFTSSTVVFPANGLVLHPGPGGQYSIVRYTAPAAGLYAYSAFFTGQDTGGTTTDVHVVSRIAGVTASVFDGAVAGYLNTTSTNSLIALGAGDSLDLRVGYGTNGSFNNDSTGTNLTIQAVPEPASLAALALGAAGLLRRRRK